MYLLLTIAGIFFLGWDLYKSNKYKLILASAFLFSAIAAYKFPHKYLFMVFSFIIFGIFSYVLITTIFKREQKELQKNKTLQDFIGKTAFVKKDIGKTLSIDGLGTVEFNNQTWSAKSIDDKEIKAGQRVEIVSRENMIMNVKVLENADK